MPAPLNGSMPKFWDWLGTAKDAGQQSYMNSMVEVWAGMDAVRTDVHMLLPSLLFVLVMPLGWELS